MWDSRTAQSKAEVVYVTDSQLLTCCDAIPVFRHRAHLTHALISSYGLLHKVQVMSSEVATEEDIRKFHSQEYVEFLQKGVPEEEVLQDEFGLGFDCPILDNLWGLVCGLAGGSLTAAKELTSGRAKIALNWCGGWHHAQRDMASGFCYVNDIVLAILQLRSVFPKVLYLDLDVHHGDAVESAFFFSPKVVTVSFHQKEPGFFPGTGAQEDTGLGKGRLHNLNIPYKEGINDKQFVYLFESVLYPLCEVFMPDAVVCQCGADALNQDPLGGGNLTLEAFTTCATHVANLSKPTLFLGGGGYKQVNAAKLWTAITGTLVKCPLPAEIPEHQFFMQYGPSFELEVTAGLRKSCNTQESLDQTVKLAHGKMKLFLILSLYILTSDASSPRTTGTDPVRPLETLNQGGPTCSSPARQSSKVNGQGFCEIAQENELQEESPTQDDDASQPPSPAEERKHDSSAQTSITNKSSADDEVQESSSQNPSSQGVHPHQSSSTEGDHYNTASLSPKGRLSQNSEGAEQIEKWDQPARRGEEHGDAVRALQQEGDLEVFTSKGSVAIVYFYRNSGSAALIRFLNEYKKSAQDLLQYNVLLATVDCGKYQVASYCASDKINRFAYGFRGGQEKIAFPLDTLFNSNAIVASALHLALINTVPILQTAGERRNLEKRCRSHCDLIFAYLRTLGTPEHRTFLEVAHTYQSSFVFAITTYTAGTLGLPPHAEEEEQEKGVWVIHCRDKSVSEECVVSSYRGKMMLPQLFHFINVLQLPLWHEVSRVPVSQELTTPYDEVDLPWVLLLHDDSSAGRVKVLAPSLAQLLHGSVAIITVSMEGVTKELLGKLGLNYHTITTPALAFLQRDQKSATTLLNDYDDALEWVKEQLMVMYQKEPQSKEEQGYLPIQEVEELQQDDEVVLGMVEKDSFPGVVQLAGPVPYHAALKTKRMAVIAFHLAWDPVSNALLQHLNAVAPLLEEHNCQASLYSVNCFDWNMLCDSQGLSTYPVLRLHPYGRRNVTFNGPINYHHILRTILLLERDTPVELTSVRAVEDMLALKGDMHPAAKFANAAVVGVFPTEKDASAFREACHMLEGNQLLSLHVSQETVSTYCASKAGCVVVSKPGDIFQPWRTLEAPLPKSPSVTSVFSHAALNVMDQLDPERYSAVHIGTENVDEAPFKQHLIIVFLPSHTLQSHQAVPQSNTAPWSSSSRGSQRIPQDTLLITAGFLAAKLSEPGFIFSWLTWDDPLAQQLGPVYGLSSEGYAVVGVAVGEGAVHIVPQGNFTHSSLKDWLTALREGHGVPSVMLSRKMWEPRLPGFDFLKFMQEDQDHDAEDHLVLEMEADLTSKHHQGTGERSSSKKLTPEEL